MMITASIARVIILITLSTAQMPSREAAVSAALSELEKGRIFESIQRFKEIIRVYPADAVSYFYLSTLYTQMSEYTVAESYLKHAMELNPKQGAHYYQLGVIRYRQKQWVEARNLFKQALELGPGNYDARVWKSIGDVQLELFDRDAALQAYTEALRLQPRDAQTRLSLGRFYLDRGEPDRAVEQLLAALENDPSLQAAYPVLGRAYRQSGNFNAAINILKKALDTNPGDQESRYALGQTFLAMGRTDEGHAEMDKYDRIRQQVVDAEANYKAGLARLELNKFAEAEKLLREAVRLAPTYGPALHSLGTLLLDHGSAGAALPLLQRAAQANPLNAANWFSLGTAYFKLGKMTEALAAANHAIDLNDDEPRYQRLMRDIQERSRK